MESQKQSSNSARRCRLLQPIRDRQGNIHFAEFPLILRELVNLGRQMLLVQFGDGSTTFVFPEEVSDCE
jgi:hypothetical protein